MNMHLFSGLSGLQTTRGALVGDPSMANDREYKEDDCIDEIIDSQSGVLV